jgi:F-type H+-transporting ATPase subunit delta
VKDSTVAARYAKALFLTTEKRGETAAALGDVQGLLEVFRPGTRVAAFMASPQTRLADKRTALKSALDGRVGRTVVVFLDLLLRKKRLPEFAAAVSEFEALVERAQGVKRALVVSAVPLEDTEARRLHETLERWTNSTIKLTREVDPALLGGALVRIGDRLVDRSVRTLLESIAKQLNEASV